MPRRLSSGMTKDTRPLLLVTSVLKYTHSPDGGWVMMWRSTCTGCTKWWAQITQPFLTWVCVCCCDDKREITFSPAKVTMSRGPYMKRPVTTCWESSVNTASFTRWLAVTFCERDTCWTVTVQLLRLTVLTDFILLYLIRFDGWEKGPRQGRNSGFSVPWQWLHF